MRFMHHKVSTGLPLFLAALALSAACFKHPADKVDQMVCSQDTECPSGYHCIIKTGSPGQCLRQGTSDSAPSSSTAGNTGRGGSGGNEASGGTGGNPSSSTVDTSTGTGGSILGGVGGTTPLSSDSTGVGGTTSKSQSAGGGGATVASGGTAQSGGTVSGGSTVTATATATASGGAAGKAGSTGGTTSAGGTTTARECSPGEHLCKDRYTLLTCDNGKWPSQGTECEFACKDNQCTGECKPGKDKCGPNDTLLTCDDNGAWPLTGRRCAFVCRSDACTGVCMPGQYSCSENSEMKCGDDGQWPASGYTACAPGYSCAVIQAGCYCALTTCSGKRCVDTTKDPQNCGNCDVTCPGACVGGACSCAIQSSSNLVPNGGFDLAISGWDIRSDPKLSITRATLDAANCSSSGSLYMTYQDMAVGTGYFVTGPCVTVDPSLTYNIGGWIYLPKTSVGIAVISVMYYSDSDCTIVNSPNSSVTAGYVTVFDTWKQVRAESVTPTPGTKAAHLEISLSANKLGLAQAYFDALYISRTPGHF